ncbi:MAG TPA: sugar phosphate isomerase/epimerase family protein [Clostridiaceae bacterium]
MKISFSTLSCPDWSWNKVLDEAVRLGFEGIEVRGADGEMYLPKAIPFLPENINRTKEQLKLKGLEITDLGSSCSFHEAENFQANIIEGKEYIDLAAVLGVPYIRVFGNNVPDSAKAQETLDRIASGLKELSLYGEGKNVMVLVETHGDFPELNYMIPVLEKVNSPYLGVLWDIEHTYKRYGEDIEEFFNKTKAYIKHVHVKDTKKGKDGFHICMIGEGDVNIKKDIDLLKEYGYKGYLSLEWEKKWVPSLEEPEVVMPIYVEFIKKLL